jgi:hypothetical protein
MQMNAYRSAIGSETVRNYSLFWVHQQNDKKLSAFWGFSGCRQAHKCAVFLKSQDYEAIWGPQLGE